jgi:zinc protease
MNRLRSLSVVLIGLSMTAALLADGPMTAEPATSPTTIAATLPATLPTARQVIDQYVAVTGGAQAYADLKSRRAAGTVSIADQGIEGAIDIALRSDEKAAVSITLKDLGTVRQGMNGGVVWQIHPITGPKIFEGEEAESNRRSMLLGAEASLDGYAKADVVEIVDLNGRPAYRMVLSTPSGATETRLYDIESGLLVRTLAKLDSSVGEMMVTSLFTDYEDAPPIRMPMKLRQQLPGLSPESVMTKVEHNVELPDELFALPPEIVELQKQLAKPANGQ